jgi:hypothetical protein
MAYRPGDAILVTGPPEWDDWKPEDGIYSESDDRAGRRWEPPFIKLDHSCGDWIIGGRTEVLALIEDLKASLAGLP